MGVKCMGLLDHDIGSESHDRQMERYLYIYIRICVTALLKIGLWEG